MKQEKAAKRRQQRRRLTKKSGSRKNRLRLIGIAIVGLLIGVTLLVVAWKHYQESRAAQFQGQLKAVQNGSAEAFSQISPDTPLYVLIVGVDKQNPQQANFIGIAAVNKEKKHIDFIMLPDNTKIEGRREKGAQELQSVYSEGGLPLLQAVVEDIFHITVHFYAQFTEDTFIKLIDMSGGLPMYVEQNMYHADHSGTTDINLFQGYQKLDGREAMGYMRYIDQDGYLSRTQRQERLVKLFYTDRQTHFGFTNMIFAYRFWNQVDSNISAKDMASLAFAFRNVPASDFNFYILPGELSKKMDRHEAGTDSYWVYDPVEVQKVIGNTNNAIVAAPDPESKNDAAAHL